MSGRNKRKSSSILKAPKARLPLQVVQELDVKSSPDDDATTHTALLRRRVSFGKNFVKEFIAEADASVQYCAEYEQLLGTSDSSNNTQSDGVSDSNSTIQSRTQSSIYRSMSMQNDYDPCEEISQTFRKLADSQSTQLQEKPSNPARKTRFSFGEIQVPSSDAEEENSEVNTTLVEKKTFIMQHSQSSILKEANHQVQESVAHSSIAVSSNKCLQDHGGSKGVYSLQENVDSQVEISQISHTTMGLKLPQSSLCMISTDGPIGSEVPTQTFDSRIGSQVSTPTFDSPIGSQASTVTLVDDVFTVTESHATVDKTIFDDSGMDFTKPISGPIECGIQIMPTNSPILKDYSKRIESCGDSIMRSRNTESAIVYAGQREEFPVFQNRMLEGRMGNGEEQDPHASNVACHKLTIDTGTSSNVSLHSRTQVMSSSMEFTSALPARIEENSAFYDAMKAVEQKENISLHSKSQIMMSSMEFTSALPARIEENVPCFDAMRVEDRNENISVHSKTQLVETSMELTSVLPARIEENVTCFNAMRARERNENISLHSKTQLVETSMEFTKALPARIQENLASDMVYDSNVPLHSKSQQVETSMEFTGASPGQSQENVRPSKPMETGNCFANVLSHSKSQPTSTSKECTRALPANMQVNIPIHVSYEDMKSDQNLAGHPLAVQMPTSKESVEVLLIERKNNALMPEPMPSTQSDLILPTRHLGSVPDPFVSQPLLLISPTKRSTEAATYQTAFEVDKSKSGSSGTFQEILVQENSVFKGQKEEFPVSQCGKLVDRKGDREIQHPHAPNVSFCKSTIDMGTCANTSMHSRTQVMSSSMEFTSALPARIEENVPCFDAMRVEDRNENISLHSKTQIVETSMEFTEALPARIQENVEPDMDYESNVPPHFKTQLAETSKESTKSLPALVQENVAFSNSVENMDCEDVPPTETPRGETSMEFSQALPAHIQGNIALHDLNENMDCDENIPSRLPESTPSIVVTKATPTVTRENPQMLKPFSETSRNVNVSGSYLDVIPDPFLSKPRLPSSPTQSGIEAVIFQAACTGETVSSQDMREGSSTENCQDKPVPTGQLEERSVYQNEKLEAKIRRRRSHDLCSPSSPEVEGSPIRDNNINPLQSNNHLMSTSSCTNVAETVLENNPNRDVKFVNSLPAEIEAEPPPFLDFPSNNTLEISGNISGSVADLVHNAIMNADITLRKMQPFESPGKTDITTSSENALEVMDCKPNSTETTVMKQYTQSSSEDNEKSFGETNCSKSSKRTSDISFESNDPSSNTLIDTRPSKRMRDTCWQSGVTQTIHDVSSDSSATFDESESNAVGLSQDDLIAKLQTIPRYWEARKVSENSDLWSFKFKCTALELEINLKPPRRPDGTIEGSGGRFISNVTHTTKPLLRWGMDILMKKLSTKDWSSNLQHSTNFLVTFQKLIEEQITPVRKFIVENIIQEKKHNIKILGDSLSFDIVSFKCHLWFKVSLKMDFWEKYTPHHISVENIVGETRESEVKNLITGVKKDIYFLRNYIRDIEDYVRTLEGFC